MARTLHLRNRPMTRMCFAPCVMCSVAQQSRVQDRADRSAGDRWQGARPAGFCRGQIQRVRDTDVIEIGCVPAQEVAAAPSTLPSVDARNRRQRMTTAMAVISAPAAAR